MAVKGVNVPGYNNTKHKKEKIIETSQREGRVIDSGISLRQSLHVLPVSACVLFKLGLRFANG